MLLHALVLVLLSNLCPLQEQYQSIHEALLVFIDSFETYSNFSPQRVAEISKACSQVYVCERTHAYNSSESAPRTTASLAEFVRHTRP